jgi:hypothetical protein
LPLFREDSQAVDRCYRIGQTKEVVVFRFIAAGTVEAKMYEKQVHKDGLAKTVLTKTGSATQRYFDREDLRKLFQLAPEGKCDVLDRLQKRGQASLNSSAGEEFLASHKGIVGCSSHDGLYSTESLVTMLEDEIPKENPFSSPTPKLNLWKGGILHKQEIPENQKINAPNKDDRPKVVGRSQRALLMQKTSGKARFSSSQHEKVNSDNNVYEASENPLETLRRVDALFASGKKVEALSLVMDVLDDRYQALGKNEKMQAHKSVAVIADQLGWID